MSLLLCGIVISSMAAPAFAQQRQQAWNWRPDHAAAADTWQQSEAHNRDFTPPAPRGDLRGDIASNVRARPDASHGEPARRR
jgi:Ni/Co efflux regulator RcnB